MISSTFITTVTELEVLQREEIAAWFQELQDQICQGLEQTDGNGKFHQDQWGRPGGGGGITRTITNGRIIEKGGVNFSEVHGATPKKILEALGFEKSGFLCNRCEYCHAS